jgi:hypothetical protein
MVLLNDNQILTCNKLGEYAYKKNNTSWGNPNLPLIKEKYNKYIDKYCKILLSKNIYCNENNIDISIIDTFKILLYLYSWQKYHRYFGGGINEKDWFIRLNLPNIEKSDFKLSIKELNILKKSMGLYYKNKNDRKVLLNKEILDDVVDDLWHKLVDIKNEKEKYNFKPQKKDVLDELKKKIEKVDSVNYVFSKYFKSKIKYTCSNSIMRDFKRFSEFDDDWY